MAKRMPAAPASAEPRPKVKEMTVSVFTPMSAAAVALLETARIAMPSLVRLTMKLSAMSREIVTPNTTIWFGLRIRSLRLGMCRKVPMPSIGLPRSWRLLL